MTKSSTRTRTVRMILSGLLAVILAVGAPPMALATPAQVASAVAVQPPPPPKSHTLLKVGGALILGAVAIHTLGLSTLAVAAGKALLLPAKIALAHPFVTAGVVGGTALLLHKPQMNGSSAPVASTDGQDDYSMAGNDSPPASHASSGSSQSSGDPPSDPSQPVATSGHAHPQPVTPDDLSAVGMDPSTLAHSTDSVGQGSAPAASPHATSRAKGHSAKVATTTGNVASDPAGASGSNHALGGAPPTAGHVNVSVNRRNAAAAIALAAKAKDLDQRIADYEHRVSVSGQTPQLTTEGEALIREMQEYNAAATTMAGGQQPQP